MSRNDARRVLPCLLAALMAAASARAQDVKIDSEVFSGLGARPLGPAAMSGRIAALDAVAGDRLTIYAGAAGGGVWKSVDGGLQFKPVFDKHTQSIGAIAVDPSDAKKVWVGTGESWTRNSVSVGDGVYRSVDAGENWERVGLEDTERIARIAVDPRDGQTVFACATGHLFDSHPARGVYRTKDGGKTWSKVFFVNADTGCADLAVDPQDGRIVYAAMWQFRRKPHFFESGGPGSGLFKSIDGGTTWQKLTRGLPEGPLGRIAIAVAPSRPSVVYATVEAKKTALYRSDDMGATWTEVGSTSSVTSRPFYFSRLVADPSNYDRVYKPATFLSVSEDGGKTFSGVGGSNPFAGGVHSDYHALWINPKNSEEMIVGTDGGVYHSRDRGHHWRFVGTLPVSQFYHVSVDMEYPYNVYGGLQDNNSWMAPSRKPGGISNRDWKLTGFGDGFWSFVDPTDADIVFSEYQGGNLLRFRKSTGEIKDIKPYAREGEAKYRFNWNTPIHLSPTQAGTMYYGAQFLFRSKDRGDSWERVSPDLTTNDPAKQKQEESGGLTADNSTAENHCTIFAIAESPKDARLIWVGTDDGNLQLTRDGGKTWTNVGLNLPGLPKNTWVASVEASRFDAATAFATFDGHMAGDMKPYVYRTTDSGSTWTALATPDLKGYAHVVRQDRVNPNLLFLGTESGLFVSLDAGAQWAQFTGGFPSVAVRDIAIHPRDHDVVLATHGRGVWIIDDITPLRQLTPKILDSEVAFLESRPSTLVLSGFEGRSDGDGEYTAPSPDDTAGIAYYLKKRHMFGDLKLEIYDSKGNKVSTFTGGKRRGLNRVEWPMRLPPPRIPAATSLVGHPGAFTGPRVPEGTYTVKLIKGKDTFTSELTLLPDPRSKSSPADRALQQETAMKLYRSLERLTFVVESISDARDQARSRAAALPKGDALRKQLEAYAERMEASRKELVSTKQTEGITGEEKLREEIGSLYGAVNIYEGRPTESQIQRMGVLDKQLEAARAKLDATAKKELGTLNPLLQGRKLDPLKVLSEDEWRGRQAKT